jgi:carbamoyltransferase
MPPISILGISAFYHDSAACIVQDGRIVAAAQEERFTRKKHDPAFPEHAVAYCLDAAGIAPGDIDHVAFYDKPWLKFERLLETYLAFAPSGIRSFLRAMPLWLKEKLWMGELIQDRLGHAGDIWYPEHHQSHAASAFYPSPFDRAAILTLDGVGEWATTSWGIGHGHRIDLSHEIHFPHSLGLLYSAFTYYTGFRVNSGEYKLMGLAPYGTPLYTQDILDHLIDLREDGSYWMDMAYFNYCQGLTMTSDRFHRLFGGPPRSLESPIGQREMDLAASVQAVVEEAVLRMARHIRKETGERRLCLAGGVALNCVANGRLLSEGIFDDMWIQPAAGDAGGALGAALFVWHQALGNTRPPSPNGRDSMRGALLGPAVAPDAVVAWLDSENIPYTRLPGAAIAEETARLLADGQVVGWVVGQMEFGPRALGARSILGDPRSPTMQSTLNLKIKFRESFRPFAPACLEEEAGRHFALDRPSPYMLLVAPIHPDHQIEEPSNEPARTGFERLKSRRSHLPAVTHVDYSARIQTVDADANPAFRTLLEAFFHLTGCPVLVNTSFNVRGEPIVCTPQEAYRCFLRTEMDALVLEDCLLLRSDQPADRAVVLPPPSDQLD